MSRGNTFSIIGNITRDAEVRVTPSGNSILQFGIAWNERRKNQQTGDYEDSPHFFDVKMWLTDAQLSVIEHQIVTGAKVAIVDGHLTQERWEHEGKKHSKVVLMVDDPFSGLLVGKKNDAKQSRPNVAKQQAEAYSDEDIPF